MRRVSRIPSVGATAFRFWRVEYGKLHPEAFGENEAFGAPKSEDEQRDAVQALGAAAAYLKTKFGTALVPWGQLLRLRRGDLDLPLDGDVGFFGGVECLRSTGTQNQDESGRFVFNGGQDDPLVAELDAQGQPIVKLPLEAPSRSAVDRILSEVDTGL